MRDTSSRRHSPGRRIQAWKIAAIEVSRAVYALDEPVDSPANVGPAFIEEAQSQATESSPASSVGSLATHQGIEMKADSQVPPRRKRGG